MNFTLFLRLFFVAGLVALPAGCSSIVLDRMPNVNQFSWETERTYTRSGVIKEFGEPAKSTALPQHPSATHLAASGHPAFPKLPRADAANPAVRGYLAKPKARVATIDEYELRGPLLATGSDLLAVVWAKQAAVLTLGLSELYFFPAALSLLAEGRKEYYRLYVAYSPSGTLVAHRLHKKK